MLILKLKQDETLYIDDGRVRILLRRILDSKIEIAVTAPPDVTVDREEIHLAKQRERAQQ